MSTLTLNIFNVTDHCPVCSGSANARYHGSNQMSRPQMKRKCGDCGFTWEAKPVLRYL